MTTPWVWFDARRLKFIGWAPDVGSTTVYPLVLTAYDKDRNYVQIDFTITVEPNKVCTPDPSVVTTTCVRGQYCTYTVVKQQFHDDDQDELFISDNTYYQNYSVEGMKFTALNHTFHGYPHERYKDFSLIASASDPFQGICF